MFAKLDSSYFMDKRNVLARLDDRARLMSAVLAATNFPDKSQERQKHGTHMHARDTRKLVAEFASHPAVSALQALLDRNTPLTSIYGYALRLAWPTLEIDEPPRWVPPHWNEHLKHFYEATHIDKWWKDDDESWQAPVRHLNEIFDKVDFYGFLEPFFGTLPETLVFIPNVSFPTDANVRVRIGAELCLLMPPRKAWGDSAPWPYDNDPAFVYQEALKAYEELLLSGYFHQIPDVIATLSERPLPVDEKFSKMHPAWIDQLTGLFTSATVALFLEEVIDAREAKAFIQIQQKMEGLTILPGVTMLLRRYLDDQKTGKYANFSEYLPTFVKHLRLVKM